MDLTRNFRLLKMIRMDRLEKKTQLPLNIAREHRQIMEQLGYDTYFPPVKRAKSIWELLLEQFPCSPKYQHTVWAARIRRQFKQECGLPYFWECECMKFEATTAAEICTFEGAIALSMLSSLSTIQSPEFGSDDEGVQGRLWW